MASAAFKSTTKRSQITGPAKTSSDDASSSSRSWMLRRSRSLSRNPGRRNPEADDFRTPKGKFVNTERGSGFPDVSLDDLADEFFMAVERDSEEERARSIGRLSRSTAASESAQRRGRSVSRGGQTAEGSGILVDNRGRRGDVENRLSRRRSLSVARYQSGHSEVRALEGKGSSENGFGRKGVSDGDSRRRRSASVARHRRGDLEARDVEMKSVSESNARRRRSLSVARYRGSDSESYSSALTEDEGWSSHANKYGIEKTIRAVYAQNKIDHPIGDEEETGFYEAMRKEVRHAVEEMRTELVQVMGKGQSNAPTNGFKSRSLDISQDITEMRKNYTTKLEQSEKRKQDLLAELAVEEQRARELSQVVKDLLPEPKSTAPVSRPSRNRRRSDDKTRMSKCLTEEAEKYFEDFISNVEDTDVSSFDGEKSDASSTLGGSIKSRIRPLYCAIDEMEENLARGTSLPVESDGVILPWLQWETSNDCSPLLCKNNTVGKNLLSAAQESSPVHNNSIYFTSSRGSCSGPGEDDSPSTISKSMVVVNSDRRRGSVFDMEEYQHLQRSEDLLLERLRLRPRIESGGLVICGADYYLNFL